MAEQRWQWAARIASRTVMGQSYILYESTMASLNEVGTYIWQRLEPGATADELVNAVTHEFEISQEQAKRDVHQFLDELNQRGLVDVC